MREGMQIEDANIPIDAKVALLDALSETGLKRIVVGSLAGICGDTSPEPDRGPPA
jgi:isopropylmalate/homocitrate/citramalate synthase